MQNHRTLLETDNLCIYYDFVNEWLYVEWIGEQTLDSIKFGSEKLLGFLIAERLHKILSDQTRVTNIFSEAAEWVATDFSPRIAAAGLEYCAFVYSRDYYSRLSAEEILNRHITSTVTIAFENLESAKEWLRSV